MAKLSSGGEAAEAEFETLFIETSLGTRLVTVIPKSLSITVQDVKGKIELTHASKFKKIADIRISDLQVEHKGQKYSLDDSMPLDCAFVDSEQQKSYKSLFVSAEFMVHNLEDVGTDVGLPDGQKKKKKKKKKRAKKEVSSNDGDPIGADAEDDKNQLLLSQVEAKDLTELIAVGREKLSSVPSGGGAVAVAAVSGGGGDAASPAAAEAKKEEKNEEKEELDVGLPDGPKKKKKRAKKVAADNVVGVDKKNDSFPQTENDISNMGELDGSVPAGSAGSVQTEGNIANAEDMSAQITLTQDAGMEAVQNQECTLLSRVGNGNVVAGTLGKHDISGNRKEKSMKRRHSSTTQDILSSGKKEQSLGVEGSVVPAVVQLGRPQQGSMLMKKEKEARKKSQRPSYQHVESSKMKEQQMEGMAVGEANGEFEKEVMAVGETNGEIEKTSLGATISQVPVEEVRPEIGINDDQNRVSDGKIDFLAYFTAK